MKPRSVPVRRNRGCGAPADCVTYNLPATCSPAEKAMTVHAMGGPTNTYHFNTDDKGNTLGKMMWADEAYSFKATSSQVHHHGPRPVPTGGAVSFPDSAPGRAIPPRRPARPDQPGIWAIRPFIASDLEDQTAGQALGHEGH